MKTHTAYISLHTKKRREFVPLTQQVEQIIRESGIQDGLALVASMHITAAVIINDYESGLWQDIMQWLEEIAPAKHDYLHHRTGEDNADADLKQLLLHNQVV